MFWNGNILLRVVTSKSFAFVHPTRTSIHLFLKLFVCRLRKTLLRFRPRAGHAHVFRLIFRCYFAFFSAPLHIAQDLSSVVVSAIFFFLHSLYIPTAIARQRHTIGS